MAGVPKPSQRTAPRRPSRDELELEELAQTLIEAEQEKRQLVFTIWRREEQVRGSVAKLDSRTQSVHIQERGGNVVGVPFLDILRVDSPEF